MEDIIISNEDHSLSLAEACALEWIDTNALGGYSSSTILNCHTRKYHGLLVAKLLQPYGKFVLLSTLEDILTLDKTPYPLTTHQYPNFIAQGGYPYFQAFHLNTHPTFIYTTEQFKLIKEILMLQGQNTVLIRYTLQNFTQASTNLSIKPFLAYRDFNTLEHANTDIHTQAEMIRNGICVSPYDGMPSMMIYSNQSCEFTEDPLWYYRFLYEEEKLRGYAFEEDLFTPGTLTLNFPETQTIILACTIENDLSNDLFAALEAEIQQRHSSLDRLQTQAQQFVIHPDPTSTSLIAGYHWFQEWGRDAMIAVPGILLYSGQETFYLQVLNHFAAHEFKGLIPNRIAPNAQQQNEYDAVDTSLWFCYAVQQYYLKTKNLEAIQPLWQTMKNIVQYYREGTLFDIKQAENGLIYAGNPKIKTTWMDVVIDGKALTPRNGAQVEVNALWYNALCFICELAKKFDDPILNELAPQLERIQKNYLALFWNAPLGCLYDFVNEKASNAQIRPNQILALSLPYVAIPHAHLATQILHVVKELLLTPYGLRSLAPTDPQYKGMYAGDATSRDTAYHNGTVWPWLLAHFTQALLNTYSKRIAQETLQDTLNALALHFTTQAALGGISEIFDGDAPHTPRGCIQQAWSVGELIRLKILLD